MLALAQFHNNDNVYTEHPYVISFEVFRPCVLSCKSLLAEFALEGFDIGMSTGVASKMFSSSKLSPANRTAVWLCGFSVCHVSQIVFL